MTQAIRLMDEDDDWVGSKRLSNQEFAEAIARTGVDDRSESNALFAILTGNAQPQAATSSVDELFCAVASVSPSLLLEDLRARLAKRFKGDFRKAFAALDEDGGGTLIEPEFIDMAVRKLELTQREATKLFREIDLDMSGEIDRDEFLSALTIVEPSLFLE